MRAATAKPPPPVPPRPSKTVIAEALAKTKKIVSENAPLRVAPPPPPPVAVQRSSSSVNVVLQQKPLQLDRSISEEVKPSTRTVVFQSSDMKCSSKVHVKNEDDNKKSNSEDDRNHVNTLIDEMFASVLEIPDEPITETVNSTVLVVEPEEDGSKSNSSTEERKHVKFDDKKNHELLISELESMKMEQQRIMKRQRKPSQEIYAEEPSEIHHSDWVEVNDGEEVRLSSCQITIDTTTKKKNTDSTNGDIISRLSSMSSLHGLPPLPKSLSGFSLLEDEEAEHPLNGSDAATGKITSNLDAQLAILRREMYSLRQLDLSLLSQLWSLNESIQDFRQMLQEQDDRVLSPPSPSPTPSSGEDGEGEEFYSPMPMRFRPAPPPPPLRRPSNSSSGTSSV